LLGDAAHLMTPYSGEGVNAAMRDSVELAAAIIAASKQSGSKETLSNKVRSYEKDMFKRMHKFMTLTNDVVQLMFYTEGTPRSVIHKLVMKFMSDELHPILLACLNPVVFLYFFVFKLFH